MAQQLKSTGLATNLVWYIGVDRDTDAIKDYCSSSVTADLQIGANVTKGDIVWKSNTRRYFKLGSGTTSADFMDCGTTKPSFVFDTDGQQRTLVWIGKAAGTGPRAFGGSTGNYLAGHDTSSGGSTYPAVVVGFVQRNGGNTRLSAGTKAMFGALLERGASGTTKVFWALESDSAVTISAEKGAHTGTGNYSPARWGGINGSTTHQQDEICALMCFNRLLTQSELDLLLADHEAELLEVVSGGAVEGDLTATEAADVAAITGDVIITGTIAATEAADVAAFSGGSTPVTGTLAGTEASDTAASTGTVRNPRLVIGPLKNNTGTLLANETGATVYVYQTSGAHVVTKTSQTTDGSGLMTVTDAALVSGTTYRYVIVLGSGAEGMDKSAAA